jgi:flagellar motor switch protein FliN/FliY
MNLDELLSEVDGISAPVSQRTTSTMTLPNDAPRAPRPAVDMPAAAAIPTRTPAPETAASREPSVAVSLLDEEAPAFSLPPATSLDLIMDIELDVEVELGQLRIPLKKLMAVQPKDKFVLDGRADSPLKIFVNEQLVAYGEPLVVDGSLAVRIVELLATGTEG